MSQRFQDSQLTAYLLGELPSAEYNVVEEFLMEDSELFEELQAIESQLYDDYAAGQLSEQRAIRFQSRFLQSQEDQDRLRFARALHSRANSQSPHKRSAPLWKKWLRPFVLGSGALLAFAVLFFVRPGPSSEALPKLIVLQEQGLRGEQPIVTLPRSERVTLQISLVLPADTQVMVRLLRGDQEYPLPHFEVQNEVLGVTISPSTLPSGIFELEVSTREKMGPSQIIGYYSFQNRP